MFVSLLAYLTYLFICDIRFCWDDADFYDPSTSSWSNISKSFPVDDRCELSDSLSEGVLQSFLFDKALVFVVALFVCPRWIFI